ncbi:EF-hand domain-containing protein [Kitasatospora sp. NPDC051853]|uniref:EF-hand domain-containing protein n=1 Tax=Kitasatospora sp. NPDC051853 TaxID=3364058 RepID=UPI0037BA8F6F
MTTRTVLDQKLDRSFDMLDTDQDGHIREEDLISLASRLSSAFDSHSISVVARLEGAFAALWDIDLIPMDTAHKGSIDREEWRAGVRKAVATDRAGFLGRMNTMLRAWLELCDTDDDGWLSREQFITMYGRTLGLRQEKLEVAFTMLDTDGDGAISLNQVCHAVEEYYTSEEPDTPGNWLFGPLR